MTINNTKEAIARIAVIAKEIEVLHDEALNLGNEHKTKYQFWAGELWVSNGLEENENAPNEVTEKIQGNIDSIRTLHDMAVDLSNDWEIPYILDIEGTYFENEYWYQSSSEYYESSDYYEED